MTPDHEISLRAKLKIWVAALSLWLERVVLHFRILWLWLITFILLALLGLTFPYFKILFWLGLTLITIGQGLKFNAPNNADVLARLEKESSLSHRPLRALDDTPSLKLTEFSGELWDEETARKRKAITLLKWMTPTFDFIRNDPYAIRIGLFLLLFVAFTGSRGHISEKLVHAFIPEAIQSSIMSDQAETGDIKIIFNPPAYTRQDQITVASNLTNALPVVQGTKIKVIAESVVGHLAINLADKVVPLQRKGDTDVYEAELVLSKETDAINVKQFFWPRLTIPINYIKDTSPTIALQKAPTVTGVGQIKLPLLVNDDFGIKLVRLRALLKYDVKARPLGMPVLEEQTIFLPLKGQAVEINPTFDLTGHPWAGFPVTILIEAEDDLGQSAQIEPFDMVLPERRFRNPVSHSIVTARKSLILKSQYGALPTALALEKILLRPDTFNWDTLVTLALRSSASRLIYAQDEASLLSVLATLWHTALKLEDGNITTSQQDVKAALERLQRAIQEKAPQQQIDQLMQEFQQALQEHLQNLYAQMQKNSPPQSANEPAPLENLDMSSLSDFMEQLQQELQAGDMDAALKKLQELSKLADMLGAESIQELPEDVQQQMQDIKDLQKIIDAQQNLLEDARKSKSTQDAKKLSPEQVQIKQQLSDQTRDMQSKPKSLDEADAAMKSSGDSLQLGEGEKSIPSQQMALDKLREGKSQMQDSLKQRMKGMMGLSFSPSQLSTDPFGQANGGRSLTQEDVKIPGTAERKKAYEIIKTIRERSGDLSRPQSERDYYQRLLRQW